MKKLTLALLTLLHTSIAMTATQDPNLWLGDIDSEKSLTWVRAQNATSEKALTQNPAFKTIEADLLAILDSDDKIPYIVKRGDYYYNYWQDKDHPRGIWRRTTWTKNYLILNKLEDVKTRLIVLDPAKNWAEKPLEGVPANSTASVAPWTLTKTTTCG